MRREFACEVEVDSSVETAFEVYTDSSFWQGRSIFGDIRWVHGRPWQIGSRVQAHFSGFAYGQIEQTVATFDPGRRIVLLSRIYGMTLESRIDFTPKANGCRVRIGTTADGSTIFVFGMAVESAFQRMTGEFLNALRVEANTRATAA